MSATNENPFSPEETKKFLKAMAKLEGHVSPSHHIKSLQRRLDYLAKKVGDKNASESSLHYLRAERAALEWALDKLANVVEKERAERDAANSVKQQVNPPEPESTE